MPANILARIVAVGFAVVAMTADVGAAPATAVFPFEIYDTSGEPPQPDRTERLSMATRVLSEVLEKTGRFAPVDLGPLGAEIAESGPRYQCSSCFLPIARKAGAALAVVGVFHKVSTLISSIDIWIFDVSGGNYVAHLSGQIRGDTPEGYEHGVRFLIRNRLPDEFAGDAAPSK